nr:reverse transcriptase domain-containing protein [Tanacetum cinerariifolium]
MFIGVKEGKFLGYMITSEGIRANPKKTRAMADMQSSRTVKEMQSLSGKLAALTRFVSKSVKQALPFFETLKNLTKDNKEDFRLTNEAEQALQEMKKLILELPTLTTPGLKETLYVYLDISKDAVSGAEYTYAIRINFASTNNEAEFEALLASLRIVEKMKVRALKVKVDSKLVACHLNGEFVASSEGKAKYLAKAKELAAIFKKFAIENVHRNQNQKAYVLSKLASVAFNHLTKEVLVKVLSEKLVDVKENPPNEDRLIYAGGRGSVQKVIPISNDEVCWSPPGELYNKVGTRRIMQNAPHSMIGSSEDNAARVLLAIHASGYKG